MSNWTTVLVCGGRDFNEPALLHEALNHFHRQWPIDLLACGGQTGADYHAIQWANANAVQKAVFDVTPYQWQTHGKSCGPVRNRMMLMLNPSAVLAFPTGGPGTRDMIQAARQHGVSNIQVHESDAPALDHRG